ncbi:hypothetical protein [Burkholderia stagnalis]|uniref:hypothetical protein n=1 Tax=Burkholderia stagnalis TaxID=1503054 RepID=UPI0012D9FAD0|nr:hypothetical protein [Burkholderia stagnalis]
MSNLEQIYERFHTPSDEVAAREVAAMSDEEQPAAPSTLTAICCLTLNVSVWPRWLTTIIFSRRTDMASSILPMPTGSENSPSGHWIGKSRKRLSMHRPAER